MSTYAKKLFNPVQIAASATTYYTSPANTRTIIKKLTVTNPTVGALTYTLYLIPTGGTAADTNTLISARVINAGETQEVFEAEGQILNAGDFLQALASSATSLSLQASGIQLT